MHPLISIDPDSSQLQSIYLIEPPIQSIYLINLINLSNLFPLSNLPIISPGYTVSFASEDARNYFVGRPFYNPYDPYHDAFKQFVGPLLYQPVHQGLIVFDFTVLP